MQASTMIGRQHQLEIVAARRQRVDAARARARRSRAPSRISPAAGAPVCHRRAAAVDTSTPGSALVRPCSRRSAAGSPRTSEIVEIVDLRVDRLAGLRRLGLAADATLHLGRQDLVVLVGLGDLRPQHEVRVADAVVVDGIEGQRVRHGGRPLARRLDVRDLQHRLAGRRAAEPLEHVELGLRARSPRSRRCRRRASGRPRRCR